MRRYLIALVALLMLVGCEGNGTFRLGSSLMGDFGKATIRTHERGNRYTIALEVHSTGLYNIVRGKRIEHYRSQGTIRNGLYRSREFSIEKWANGKHTLTQYLFDYRKRKIVRRFRQWEQDKLTEDVRDTMPYFGHDDFLTVMRNAVVLNPDHRTKRTTMTVAGADNTAGRVPVYISYDPRQAGRWGAPPGGAIVQAGIAKGIFDGGKGSITAVIDAQNRPIKTVIKTVKIVKVVTATPIK
jgi:hypothetical protein